MQLLGGSLIVCCLRKYRALSFSRIPTHDLRPSSESKRLSELRKVKGRKQR